MGNEFRFARMRPDASAARGRAGQGRRGFCGELGAPGSAAAETGGGGGATGDDVDGDGGVDAGAAGCASVGLFRAEASPFVRRRFATPGEAAVPVEPSEPIELGELVPPAAAAPPVVAEAPAAAAAAVAGFSQMASSSRASAS